MPAEQTPAHAHEPDWFRVLDVVVWVSVAVIVIMAVEWIGGAIIRETIARQAQRFLRKSAGASSAEPAPKTD